MPANEAGLANRITQLVPKHSRISIEALLIAPGEQGCVVDLTDKELIAQVLACDAQKSDDKETVVMPCQLSPIKDELHALANTKCIVDAQHAPYNVLRSLLVRFVFNYLCAI